MPKTIFKDIAFPKETKSLSKNEMLVLLEIIHLLYQTNSLISFRETLLSNLPKIIDCSLTSFAQLDHAYQFIAYDTNPALEELIKPLSHYSNHRLSRLHNRWNRSLLSKDARIKISSHKVFHFRSSKEDQAKASCQEIGLNELGINYVCGAIIESEDEQMHHAACFFYRDRKDFSEHELIKIALINELISPLYHRLLLFAKEEDFIILNRHSDRNAFIALSEEGLRIWYASISVLNCITLKSNPSGIPLATIDDISKSLPFIKDGRISQDTRVSLRLPELRQVYFFWEESRKLLWIEMVDDSPLKKLLTKKQREVFDLIVQGLNNAEISFELGNSSRTIEKHCQQIFKRTKVNGRAALIKLYQSS